MKLRPLGDITFDLEPLLCELVDSHKMQKGEIIALLAMYLDIHRPECIEVYEDGSNPVMRYGPKDLK